MASKQPDRRLIHKDRFGYVFGSLKTQNYQDPVARGPGSHTFVRPYPVAKVSSTSRCIRTLAWNPTGTLIATGSANRTLRIWNPERANARYSTELRGHTAGIEKVIFNPVRDAELASCSSDGTVRFWDVRSKTCVSKLDVGGEAFTLAWSADGRVVVVGRKDDTLVPVSVESLSTPIVNSGASSSSVGEQKASSMYTILPSHPQNTQTNATTFSYHIPTPSAPDLDLLATTGDGTVRIFSYPSFNLQHTLNAHSSACLALALAPTGRYLAVGGSDALISLWDTTDWVCRRTVSSEGGGTIRGVSWSFDGRFLCGSSEEVGPNGLEIFHAETGDSVHKIAASAGVPAVAWHPTSSWRQTTTMLDFADGASAHEKSYTTIGQIPEDFDSGPQSKNAPFSIISHHALVYTTELILPRDVYTAIWSSIREKLETPRYIQVIMPLIALIEGEFFNDFVKPGSVLILSEGRPGVDDVFSLEQGILTLQMSREKYERTGLTGKPIRSGGRKHAKERFAIEIDLRQPSMLHGKKGFERIVWACRNVLNASVTWLLACDAASQKSLDKAAAALQKYQPRLLDCDFEEIAHPVVNVPPLSMDEVRSQSSPAALEDYCNDVSEWLGLISLQSPRIAVDDVIDPYLSRYAVPQSESRQPQSTALVSLRWQGVMTSRWISQLFTSYLLERRLHTDRLSAWGALSASTFRRVAVENGDGYTVLSLTEGAKPRESGFVAWEFVGASLST
ncbi:hypothetical protein ZTR_01740 [Talaromyces verruculosus]|nr:hypothetical protein ZTR_01740 [Talaromyces verruculosus]